MQKTKINTFSIALLLFIAVFGITNIPANYSALGNSSIGWFILLGIYFIPLGLIISELSSHKMESRSGMFGWISLGLNKKWGFLGAWSYYVVNIFYLPLLASRIPVLFSWTFTPNAYSLDEVVNTSGNVSGIINAVDSRFLFLFLAFIAFLIALVFSLYFKKFFSTLGKVVAWLSLFVTGLFIFMGILGIFINNVPIANPLTFDNVMPKFNIVALSTFAWIVFAIAGIETVGSYTTYVEDAKKKIPKSIIIASLLVIGGYIVGLITMSLTLTPDQVPVDSMENMIPIMYAKVGSMWGLGQLYLRLITFIYLIITITALVLWLNATVVSLFEEFPKGIFSEKIMNYKFNDTPLFGFVITIFMVILLLLICLTPIGQNVYLTLYNMTTIVVLIPYVLIAFSYVGFCLKNKDGFNIIKNRTVGIVLGFFILITTLIATFFAMFDLTASTKKDFITWAVFSGGSLILFMLIGVVLYFISTLKNKEQVK